MSTQAWGQKQKSRYDGQTFFVQHWELGVFFSPQLLGAGPEGRIVPYGTASEHPSSSIVRIPLPYELVPETYGTNDKPWANDGTYLVPDAYGCVMG